MQDLADAHQGGAAACRGHPQRSRSVQPLESEVSRRAHRKAMHSPERQQQRRKSEARLRKVFRRRKPPRLGLTCGTGSPSLSSSGASTEGRSRGWLSKRVPMLRAATFVNSRAAQSRSTASLPSEGLSVEPYAKCQSMRSISRLRTSHQDCRRLTRVSH